MKQIIATLPHHFKKIDTDLIQCIDCGIQGKGDQKGTITISNDYNDTLIEYCSNQSIEKVKIISNVLVSTFGLELNKEYECLECPEELRHLYSKDVWVYSENREELVRCLPKEYLITQRKSSLN